MPQPTISFQEARAALDQERLGLIDHIVAYVRNQKDLWAQVPELAFRADGRSGYSDNYSRAWHFKRWALDSSCGSRGVRGYTVFVELETGELIVATETRIPAWPQDILPLKIEELDAEELVAKLNAAAQAPFANSRFEQEYEKRMREAGLVPLQPDKTS